MGAGQGRGGGRRAAAVGLPDVWEPAAAVAAAFVTMGAVAALGLHLAGTGTLAPLHRLAGAVVALAVGGTVVVAGDPTGDGFEGRGLLGTAVQVHGGVDVMPLGVTLVGAVALAAGFLLPLRGRPPLAAHALAARAGAGVAAATLCLLVVLLVGQGTLRVEGLPGGGAAGLPGDWPGLPDRLVPEGGAGGPHGGGLLVGFHAGPSTVLGGLLRMVAVVAVGWLAWGRVPLPDGSGWLGRAVRPAAAATVVTVLEAVAVGTVLALAAAWWQGGRELAGAALLVAPNLVAGGLLLAVGMPWSWEVDVGGRAAGVVPADLGQLGDGGAGSMLSLGDLPAGVTWLLPAAVAVLVLLPGGVLAAVGGRRAGGGSRAGRSRVRRAVAGAASLGVGFAVAAVLLTVAAGGSGWVEVSAFGMPLLTAAADLRGEVLMAVVAGGGCGVVAGFLGGLLLDAVRRFGRVSFEDGDPSGRLPPTPAGRGPGRG